MLMSIKNIFIIDDEQQTADMLSEFIQLMGYQTKIYTQAKTFFLENKQLNEHSLLILDLNMPEMDGIEVIRLMAEKKCQLPLILISGYDTGILHSAEQLAQAHSLEIIATLTKPIPFETLKSIIKTYTKVEKEKNIGISEFELSVMELKNAILHKQLVLHYQPQINIKTGLLVGVEALVRWQHPEHGLIYPNLFIPLAEKSDLISNLTEQVIKQAVEQSTYWSSKGLTTQISINISAKNITSHSLPEQLSQILNDRQIDPSIMTLEVTESSLMGELITSLEILTRLRMKGLELSIDDFGTGFSSLSQLYRVPFTELKIDQSFVMNITHDDEARGIVEICIMLGHKLNMSVVAEGVEDEETLILLNEMGCDIAQGYYIAKPMPSDKLLEWSRH